MKIELSCMKCGFNQWEERFSGVSVTIPTKCPNCMTRYLAIIKIRIEPQETMEGD